MDIGGLIVPLFRAIKANNFEVVKEIAGSAPGILRQATKGAAGTRPVQAAVEAIVFQTGATSVDMIELLCDLGADANDRLSPTTDSALHTAVMPCPSTEELVRCLVERGADPDLVS
jgi:hypothetical protein